MENHIVSSVTDTGSSSNLKKQSGAVSAHFEFTVMMVHDVCDLMEVRPNCDWGVEQGV